MSVQGYDAFMKSSLAQYISISALIGGDVATHSRMVLEAFKIQREHLKLASESMQPGESDAKILMNPTADCILKIQEFKESNRGSQYFNHLSAIAESISALGWVAASPTPVPYIKEMADAGQFYADRVLKDWKEKDAKHADWAKAWIRTLGELRVFVEQHHTTGLVWSGTSIPSLFAQDIAKGLKNKDSTDITKGLKNEDSTNITKGLKNEDSTNITKSLKNKDSTNITKDLKKSSAPNTAPTFVRDGKKWLIEHQKSNHDLLVEGAEMNNVVYLYKCDDSTVIVKGKINSITLDSCRKTAVVFDSLVASIEFINCQSVQMQVLAKVPTISIEKTDGCQVYLSEDSLAVEIVSSKSSEVNVLVPKTDGDYAEYPVPEQYKTVVVPGKGLSTTVVENKG